MILIHIFFGFLLLYWGNSVCTAQYHLEDLQTGNIYFAVSNNSNQITTATFHYYFVGTFSMVPNIALSTQSIKMKTEIVNQWRLTSRNITNRQFSVDFIHQPLQWRMAKVGFWASGRGDITVGGVEANFGNSIKQAAMSIFVNFGKEVSNVNGSILRAYLTGYSQISGRQTSIIVYGKSLTAYQAELGIQISKDMQIISVQINYIIFNPQNLPFVSYGGGINEVNLTQAKLYNIQKVIYFSEYKFYGIVGLQQSQNINIQLSIDIDDEFYMQVIPNTPIQAIQISYLVVGIFPGQACQNCFSEPIALQVSCVSTCSADSYLVTYQDGQSGCRTCPQQYNMTLNQNSNGCVCKEYYLEKNGYCVPNIPQISDTVITQNKGNDMINTSGIGQLINSIVQTKITTLNSSQISDLTQNGQQGQNGTATPTAPSGIEQNVTNLRSNDQISNQYANNNGNGNENGNIDDNSNNNGNGFIFYNDINGSILPNSNDIYQNSTYQYQQTGIPQSNTNFPLNQGTPQYPIPMIATTSIPIYSFGIPYTNINRCKFGQIFNGYSKRCECVIGYGFYNGSCQVCTVFQRGYLENGLCYICPDNGRYINGECLCDNWMSLINGVCIVLNCLVNQQVSSGRCICKNGYSRINGQCILQCPINTVQFDGYCGICPENSVYCPNNKICLCDTGYILNSQGRCIIDSGSSLMTNQSGFPIDPLQIPPIQAIPTPELTLPGNQQCNLCLNQTFINQNNVFVVLQTNSQFNFASIGEMRAFIKYQFPDSTTNPTSAYCNQNTFDMKIFQCLLIYASGVPNKIYSVNFSYSYQLQNGAITVQINPFISLIQTRSLG